MDTSPSSLTPLPSPALPPLPSPTIHQFRQHHHLQNHVPTHLPLYTTLLALLSTITLLLLWLSITYPRSHDLCNTSFTSLASTVAKADYFLLPIAAAAVNLSATIIVAMEWEDRQGFSEAKKRGVCGVLLVSGALPLGGVGWFLWRICR